MRNLLHILFLLFLTVSCSEQNEHVKTIDWNTELVGVGYIGKEPNSLNVLFSYYPCENNQPELLNVLFKLHPKISGDTIIFPNLLLHALFRNMEIDNRISKDTSSFKISSNNELYKFTKISGHGFVPETIYFKKYPNEYPINFKYQSFNGFDRWDSFDIEINGKDSISIWLKGNPHNPYLFEQKIKTKIDELFIGSYLNLVCDNRYDTITYPLEEAIFCGSTIGETLVYNDSLFSYSTYFKRTPAGGILVNYFRSKLDKKVHSLEEFDFNINSPLKERKFKALPVAVENWKILAPPPPKK
jgi:hypothetical protein